MAAPSPVEVLTAVGTPQAVLAARPLLLETFRTVAAAGPQIGNWNITADSLAMTAGGVVWDTYRLPQQWAEAARLASRTVTPDRARAREHARERDALAQQLIADHNTAVTAITAAAAEFAPAAAHPHIRTTEKPRRPAPSYR